MYGLDKDQENQTEAILEKELGDAVVFNKKPGEIITIPRIVNLSGTVGSSPAILALSKPNEVVTIELVSEDPTTKEQSKLINTITGETDDEGKAVLNAMLVDGEYSATIYTMRSGNKITGKTVKFKVSQEVDQEFSIEGLTITEEYAHEPYVGEAGEFVKFLLSYTEKLEPIFIAKDYIEFSRTGGMVYVVQGRVDTLDNENKMVYLAYQSVTFGSAVISDASQKGAFRMVIPKGIGAGAHKLTAYAYNPKQVKATSQKQVLFQIKK
jgi:dTDP-4-dehydrorhamnose 3,5-epimerase-like enzyme